MAVLRVVVATTVAAVGGWAAAPANLGVHAPQAGGAFGSSAHVHIAHVGRVEVDLESARSAGLVRTRCVGAPLATECFVASARH